MLGASDVLMALFMLYLGLNWTKFQSNLHVPFLMQKVIRLCKNALSLLIAVFPLVDASVA